MLSAPSDPEAERPASPSTNKRTRSPSSGSSVDETLDLLDTDVHRLIEINTSTNIFSRAQVERLTQLAGILNHKQHEVVEHEEWLLGADDLDVEEAILPLDCVARVLSYLKPEQMARASEACKHFRRAAVPALKERGERIGLLSEDLVPDLTARQLHTYELEAEVASELFANIGQRQPDVEEAAATGAPAPAPPLAFQYFRPAVIHMHQHTLMARVEIIAASIRPSPSSSTSSSSAAAAASSSDGATDSSSSPPPPATDSAQEELLVLLRYLDRASNSFKESHLATFFWLLFANNDLQTADALLALITWRSPTVVRAFLYFDPYLACFKKLVRFPSWWADDAFGTKNILFSRILRILDHFPQAALSPFREELEFIEQNADEQPNMNLKERARKLLVGLWVGGP